MFLGSKHNRYEYIILSLANLESIRSSITRIEVETGKFPVTVTTVTIAARKRNFAKGQSNE